MKYYELESFDERVRQYREEQNEHECRFVHGYLADADDAEIDKNKDRPVDAGLEYRAVVLLNALVSLGLFFVPHAEFVIKYRDQSDRNEKRAYEGKGDRYRLVLEQLAGDAGHEHDRHENDDRRKGRSGNRQDHLFYTHPACRKDIRRIPFLPVDILEHDDRVVHEHADTQSESR